MQIYYLIFVSFILIVNGMTDDDDPDIDPVYRSTDPAIREPNPCEICKFFVTELMTRLRETASKEIIETGHGLDKQKRFHYQTSELRLTEALLDPHVCDKILEYQVHAERKGSLRYEKGRSETMSVLHGLQHKGVKVDLGFPEELWDEPSTEITKMQKACYIMAESYEDDIEHWYFKLQSTHSLLNYLCRDRYLVSKKFPTRCLIEERNEKLINKDKQLKADNKHMQDNASKKQIKEREEWAEIKKRQAKIDAENELMQNNRKTEKKSDNDEDEDTSGFAYVRMKHEENQKKLFTEQEKLKGDREKKTSSGHKEL